MTGLPPDVRTGFLPPEDGTGRGQGHVSYMVHVKPGLPNGTRIRNVALIQFDFGEIIGTNQIDPHDSSKGTDPKKEFLNAIDTVPPSSGVLPLPATTGATDFTVSWSGQDDPGGSGIATYDIYVSDNGGAWRLWKGGVSATSAVFTGQVGHAYGFYSVAADNVGNVEAAPAAADTQTTIGADNRPRISVSYNAAQRAVTLSWPSVAGQLYTVQIAKDLASGWTNVPEFVDRPGTGALLTFTQTNPSSTQFYRVVVRPNQ